MKNRRVAIISSLFIALIAMFALPVQAQMNNEVSVSNFQYEYTDSASRWVFSWDSIDGSSVRKFQIKGGGWLNSWKSVYLKDVWNNDGKTYALVNSVSWTAGSKWRFRLKLKLSDGSKTAWAKLTHDFN